MSRCEGQIKMGFFDRFRKENKAEIRADDGRVSFDDALLAALLGRTTVTKEIAMQIPTVSGGIDLIANIVAGTPIRLYRDVGGKAVEITDDYRLPLLNDETGDTLNANEFWHAMIRDYYVGKGGYAYLNKARGQIKSIHYVEEDRVSIIKNNDPIFKAFNINVNGAEYTPWNFLRILRNTRDGAEGVPITKENSKLIEVAYQQMQLEYAMAKRGGNKKGFLKAERRLDEASMSALKHSWASLYANDSENMMVLNKDVDFKELSDTSSEMQLDENKRTNAQEFAKIFHVSPEAMSGSEQDIGALAKLAAIPLMQVIECALNRDLLLEKEKGSLYFAFDTKELLKGSRNERAEFYTKMIEANVMQIDEARYMEDLPALGLDFIKLGLNDVLYNPKTKTVYTPNTNQTSTLNAGNTKENTLPMAADNGPEDRADVDDQPRDEKGRFAEKPSNDDEGNKKGHDASDNVGENGHKAKKITPADVTEEYFSSAKASTGEITHETGYRNPKSLADDEKVADTIHKNFGGDIQLNAENKAHNPDYTWRGKLWELKTPESENSIGKRIQDGLRQIRENPGGIICDVKRLKGISQERVEEIITNRMYQSLRGQADVIILNDDKVLKVLRYKE